MIGAVRAIRSAAAATPGPQAACDVLGGVVFLIVSSVYAHDWPATYKDAPKAPGLVLSANVLGLVDP